MISAATRRRLDVLEVRIRLERAAAAAFDSVCRPVHPGRQSSIATRVVFVVGLVDAARQPETYRLAKLGAHVYWRTSDVLHGRLNALDLSDVVVAEWRKIVEDLEHVLTVRSGP